VLHATAPEARGAHLAFFLLSKARQIAVVGLVALLLPSAPARSATLLSAQGDKPPFTLSDTDNTSFALMAQRGRTVLVHFFATWCEPCREELPALSRLVERARDHKLSVVAISVAEVPVRVQRFLGDMPVNFPVLLDQDRAVAKSWDVSALPSSFILDADLKTRFAIERDYDWDRLDLATLLEDISREDRR
jgi:thiol-disulfide isomerase/thioredoxin